MPSNRPSRSIGTQCVLALCSLLALSGCAAHYAQVPARLNLAPYRRIAVITFSDEQSNSAMSTLATQRFAEALLSSQSGVELLELGNADPSLRALATAPNAGPLAQKLGREKDIPAVFVGSLKFSGTKSRGHLDGSGVAVRSGVTGELTVRLLSTTTGGTLWRSSATTDETVSRVAVSGRRPSIAVRDQDEAYGEAVRTLVANVTRDLRPTWVKQ
ncbi:MAG TPA: hypothetical protein VHR41_07635 [Gemmatimonadales bacterium]|jgi:hypothetical protein|nr:hypothetical protein [Gemmatimonadales bacterium]